MTTPVFSDTQGNMQFVIEPSKYEVGWVRALDGACPCCSLAIGSGAPSPPSAHRQPFTAPCPPTPSPA